MTGVTLIRRPHTGRLRRLIFLVAVFAAAGCATIPTSGPIVIQQPVPGEPVVQQPDIRLLAAPPMPGESPAQTVAGFLAAEGSDSTGHGVARMFLTAAASAGWDPHVSTTIYDDQSLTVVQTAPDAVLATASAVASLQRDGELVALNQPLRLRFPVVRVNGQWRLAGVPPGELLSAGALARGYRLEQVYFLTQSQRFLVPESLYLPASAGLPTEVARALLAGPPSWLRPVAVSAIPVGTQLSGSVVVSGGIAGVDLGLTPSAVSANELSPLLAQVAATFAGLAGVGEVRLTGNGQPLTLAGGGSGLVALSAASPYRADASAAPAARAAPTPAALSFAVSPGEHREALALPVSHGQALELLGPAGQRRLVSLPAEPRSLSFLPDGTLLAATSAGLFSVNRAGEAAAVLDSPPCQLVSVAPDGVRVALLADDGALGFASLAPPAPGRARWRLSPVRPLALLAPVHGLAWSGESTVVALAGVGASSEIALILPGSTDVTTVKVVPPLPRSPSWLAAAAGQPVLLGLGSEVWSVAGGQVGPARPNPAHSILAYP